MAGVAERTLALKLIADVGDINKPLKQAEGRMKRMGKSAVSWGKAFSGSLAIAGIEATVDLIGDAWEGFRSGQKVAAQLGVTWKNLGLAGRDLAGTLDRVTSAATRMGMSDDDAVEAFNESLKRTRDSNKSYRELKIAMDLVANGAAPDLQSAMRIIQQAGKGSARVVDRFGLDSKTAAGRIRELGDKVRGAARKAAALNPVGVLINGLNEDLEGIVGNLATGNIDGAIDSIAGAADRLAEAWGRIDNALPPQLRAFINETAPKLQTLLQALGANVAALGTAFAALSPIIDPIIGLFKDTLSGALDAATGGLRLMTDILKGDFTSAWNTIKRVVDGAVQGMIAAWNRLDIRVPPFELTWGGGTILPGTPFAFDIPSGSFRFWSGTGDLFPDVGRSWDNMNSGGRGPSGGGGNRARMYGNGKKGGAVAPPEHEDGLDYVPYDGYIASLHRGERVLTAEQNSGNWGGGVTVVVNGYVGSEAQLARELNRILASGVQRGMRLGYR